MSQITLREYGPYREPEIDSLYRSVGWSAYYSQPQLLRDAFAHSLYILGAYDEERLVGIVRAVGDGISVVFLQDLLVHPQYQRRGIGRRLIAAVLKKYSHVRQLHLLTDDTADTVQFYEAVGFEAVENIHCKAFTRLRF